jgi:hypothetical protein
MKIALLHERSLLWLGVGFLAISFWSTATVAQDLKPRAYWPTPKGTNVVTLSYQYSTGDVVTDPSLPVTGVDSRINYIQFAYLHSFSLLGRTTIVHFDIPYTWGASDGIVEGEARSRHISAVADASARLSINLLGAPTMDAVGFQALRAKPHPLIGASFTVRAPTGGYEPDKLINAGTNRWAVKPSLGFILPIRPRWLVELEFSAWLFGDNDDFLGVTREQDPVLSSEIHLIRRIRAGFWASLDLNFYFGGRTTVDQNLSADLQRNSRFGGTLVYPLKGHHAIRGSFSTGIVTESGGDFKNLSLSYLYLWR